MLKRLAGGMMVLALGVSAVSQNAAAGNSSRSATENGRGGIQQVDGSKSGAEIVTMLNRLGFSGHRMQRNGKTYGYIVTRHVRLGTVMFSVYIDPSGKTVWLKKIAGKLRNDPSAGVALSKLLSKPHGKTRIMFFKENLWVEQPIDNHGLTRSRLSDEISRFLSDAALTRSTWASSSGNGISSNVGLRY